jgi:RNA polymerase sigma factor (sigma-70 family)
VGYARVAGYENARAWGTVGSMPEDRFEALLDAARGGDEAAWAEIYGELAPTVLGYLRGSGARDPEDTLAETFLQVARDLGRFSGDYSKFRAWTFTIAHHRLIDARRSAARRPLDLVADVPEPSTNGAAPDAADEAVARIGAEELERVLGALTPEQRAVVLLRVIGDLSITQVAEALGKRAGAIKQLQRRGLAAVKRELTQLGVTQ